MLALPFLNAASRQSVDFFEFVSHASNRFVSFHCMDFAMESTEDRGRIKTTKGSPESNEEHIAITPLRVNMESEDQPLKGDSFQKPSWSGSMLNFRGVTRDSWWV